MRLLGLKNWCKAMAFTAVVLGFSTSCKEDDPVRPDYVGTWETVESVPDGSGGHVQEKNILILNETSYTSIIQMELSAGKWIDYASLKGTATVTGNFMNVIVTEIGVTSLNMITGLPTGVMTTYQKGSDEYDTLMAQLKEAKTFESKFMVEGNKLTLQIDINGDGDYMDEQETSVYTKK